PLRHWVANFRDEYLRVLVTQEGFMGQEPCCPCGQPGTYRCSECFGTQMFCCECLVEGHSLRPLCRIEVSSPLSFFLWVQLGHADNRPCPHAQPGRDKFVVIVPNGFHHVAVDFCQCQRS
ncbi:hypothetical protein DFH08DRAFT_636654, partial [Mycena albidolilacea]